MTKRRRLLVNVDVAGWQAVVYEGTTDRARAKVEALPTSQLLPWSRNSSEVERRAETGSSLRHCLRELLGDEADQIASYIADRFGVALEPVPASPGAGSSGAPPGPPDDPKGSA